MKSEPLVTAIIPTFNRAGVVGEAIDSVLQQTYSKVEVIVVDDGSTDGTPAMLRRYGNAIRVITQENAGPSAARNRGIACANGSIVAFLDSDDLWLPAKLERQVALLQRLDASVPCCLCNIAMRWKTKERSSFESGFLKPAIGEGIWLNPDEVLATRFVLFTQGVAIRRATLERIGGFDERLRLLEDHELALRLSPEGPWAFIADPMVVWRETKGSLYQNAKRQELNIAQVYVQILRQRLETDADKRGGRIAKCLRWELDTTLRHIRALQIGDAGFCGAAAAGKALLKVEQYRNTLLRRSPGYPHMKVEPLHAPAAHDPAPGRMQREAHNEALENR
jgi:glycosyltransferase involved in cell wall biosynthesis